jgi:drug/metabolite transporter (DMT)-like permease
MPADPDAMTDDRPHHREAAGSEAVARDRFWVRSHDQAPVLRRPAVYLLAAATVAVLGLNWPIMSIGVDHVPPLWLAAFRLGGAALVVAAGMATRGVPRPRGADRPILWSVGLARLALVTALVFSALEFVPPGRSSILVYTASLWTVPLAVVFLHERLTPLRIAGLTLGTAGVVLLIEPWAMDWSDDRLLLGLGMLLVAAIANASTTVHIRAHRWAGTPFELMPWQFAVAAVPILLLAVALEGVPAIRWTAATVGVVAYQVFLGSAFGFWGLLTISRSLPAITTNLTLMAVPVVGLLSSIPIANERLTPSVALSLLLVLAGVGLGVGSDRRSRDPVPVAA